MSNLLDDFSNIVSREEDAKKRKRIGKACVYCNRSHMSCEEARPCHRCVERGIAHLCRDIETNRRRGRKAGYLIDDMPKVDLLAEDIPKVKPPRVDSTPSSSAILPPNTVIPKSVKSDSITIEERMKSLDANIMTIEANNTIGMHIDQNVLSDLSSDIEHLPEDLKMLLNDFFANSVTSDRYLNQAIIEPQHSFLEPGDVLARNLGNILKTRLPDDAQRLGKLYSELMTNMSKHFLELYPHFTPEMFKQVTSLEGVQHEIETQVAKFKQMFDSLPTPIIVFDRNGCVHYVNTAYKSLTGFGLPLPTGRFDYTFYSHILSPASFKEFMEYMVNVLSDWPDKVSDNGYLMNCSLRFHNESRESFIEGTMSVCLLRDKFGIPYLNLGTFLPMLAKSIVVTANNRFVLRDTPSENSAKPSSV